MNNWLDSLLGITRERVLSEMQRIRSESDSALERHRFLQPRYGEIEVGGGAFDEFLWGESLATLLRELGRGMNPEAATASAKLEARLMVAKWNTRRGRDYQTHRSVESMDAKLMDLQRALRRASAA